MVCELAEPRPSRNLYDASSLCTKEPTIIIKKNKLDSHVIGSWTLDLA